MPNLSNFIGRQSSFAHWFPFNSLLCAGNGIVGKGELLDAASPARCRLSMEAKFKSDNNCRWLGKQFNETIAFKPFPRKTVIDGVKLHHK